MEEQEDEDEVEVEVEVVEVAGEHPNSPTTRDKATTKVRKTLADHIYYMGSACQASDFSVITNFLINHICQTFEYGNDIANALESKTPTDFALLR